MNRLVLWAMVCVALMVANPVAADDGFYVVGMGGGVGTKITSVPYTISTPGFYYLAKDLTLTTSGSAITVEANDVTIDLMGFTLNYTGSTMPVGVYMNGRNNVEVRNGTVTNFENGISEGSDDGMNHRVINIRAHNNKNPGIALKGSGHLVKGCNSSHNGGMGILVVGGTVANCVANSNGMSGIWLYGPGSVIDNTANNNTSNNFLLGAGAFTSILLSGNSAFGGPAPNYRTYPLSSGIITGVANAGTP